MTLAELQRAFEDDILTSSDALSPIVSARGQRGIRVYRHAYRATLKAALADTFEKTKLWLGEDAFEAAASAYLAATPSRSWTLSDYGASFPDRLAERYPDDPEIAELAWLDGSLRRAFAAGNAAIDPSLLADIEWGNARFTFAPHAAFRPVATNVAALWNSLPDAPIAAAAVDGTGIVVWRESLSPQFRSASAAEVALLLSLAAGESFGAACAALTADDGTDAADIGLWLAAWLEDGLIGAID